MARGERTCVVCGTKYIYCPNCKQGDPEETWRYNYCSEECRDVFDACSQFVFGHKTADEAKKMLAKYDLSNVSKFNKGIRRNLSAMNAQSAKVEEPKVEEPKDEAAPEKKENKSKNNKNGFVNKVG